MVGNTKITKKNRNGPNMPEEPLFDKDNMSIYFREAGRFLAIVQKTIAHVCVMKEAGVFNGNELNQALRSLESCSNKIHSFRNVLIGGKEAETEAAKDGESDSENKALFLTGKLQAINNDLASIFRSVGTKNLRDLLTVCLGNSYLSKLEQEGSDANKLKNLLLACHPVGYKLLPWKEGPKAEPDKSVILKKTCIVEDLTIVEHGRTLDCFDLGRTSKEFFTKVHGIKIVIQNAAQKKTLIISAIVDNLPPWSLDTLNVPAVTQCLLSNCSASNEFDEGEVTRFVECLSLKDFLIFSIDELWTRYVGYCTQAKMLQQLPLSQVVKEFLCDEPIRQRTTMLQLLMKSGSHEFQYLAYLLYDLLSSETDSVGVDTRDQTQLFDSLPIRAKQLFKEALQNTVNYSKRLTNFDANKIPLEQQICLMKASDAVKERAMQKLKEVKNKNEDSGTKARQYLEGLLRIPFGIFRKEPILTVMDECRDEFSATMSRLSESPLSDLGSLIPSKETYTGLEVRTYAKVLKHSIENDLSDKLYQILTTKVGECDSRGELSSLINRFNDFIKYSPIVKQRKIRHSGYTISKMQDLLVGFVDKYKNDPNVMLDLMSALSMDQTESSLTTINSVQYKLGHVQNKLEEIQDYIVDVNKTLTEAVHGHKVAKRQIERIIGQWINGEQTGYCFGFEGPPGVGKTSLAKKGIANCLRDSDGSPRPFTFIAIGGGSNGCTLEGHNYTYVASTWGRIVDVLMEKKCMNPIIFIDELDKVSKTEHGREIIGILTHLIDPSQNDTFQDKYFNGIDLDLSKALFIFSYNDADLIDRILLDRIHRVKFDALTLTDKLVIANDYLIPDVLEKMGLTGMIEFDDGAITYLIETYTYESGVRKLKEILFEIVGEINIRTLKDDETSVSLPIKVTKDDKQHLHLKERNIIRPYKITRTEPTVGVINGLYANALGKGGVLPIEVCYMPAGGHFELQLTGSQGDVMKESMHVAKTLALKLAQSHLSEVIGKYDSDKLKTGIHVHVPEGATKKDGPSAGTAITIAMYSLLSGMAIDPYVAITGEICLSGEVTAIGGLEYKVLGGIKAGAKTFIYPEENQREYEKLVETYEATGVLEGIVFYPVKHIDEAMYIAIPGLGDC
jgi:ATP-dependent Lon protease